MSAEYEKERVVALVKEAHEITNHLKAEIEVLERQMARVLDGGEDETAGPQEGRNVSATAAKSGWSFWRWGM